MDAYYERLILRAATIDELLSEEFEAAPGGNGDADRAARRLEAWRRACASGDPALFARRLERDRLSATAAQERFVAVRRAPSAAPPAWIADAVWIEAALQSPGANLKADVVGREGEPRLDNEASAFEHLFTPVVGEAETLLWSGLDATAAANLTETARACLRLALLKELSGLCAAALYERFAKARNTAAAPAEAPRPTSTALYRQFVADMQAGGFRRLFDDKPVLLRLMAVLTRQWIDTSREFIIRLHADLPAIRCDLLKSSAKSHVAKIEGELSDPHNGGHSVLIVSFADGGRVAYKPKDLRLDVVWHDLVERLNGADPPVALKAVRAIARSGYGWTEFIEHTGCADQDGCTRFFRRAGAWLALLHAFVVTDMHQENMIAHGDHPVPIDLETVLQPSAEEHKADDPSGQAFDAAMAIIGNSVMTVGLLPAYGRSVDNNVFAMGGMTADWNLRTVLKWTDINSDAMRPAKAKEQSTITPNLPHVDGRYARFGDHIESFVAGFADYAKFLRRYRTAATPDALFEDFAGLPVRKVVRPTRFYYMLLQRLKDHRTMDDGVIWSAQADFIARLAEWDKEADPLWPLQRAERSALLALNVPHFVSPSDGDEIRDATGIAVRTAATSGMERARTRVENFDDDEISWQAEIIRENTKQVLPAAPTTAAGPKATARPDAAAPAAETFRAEADRIAAELSHLAVRRGPGAAWIGLDWLGDSEVFQLVCLGPDLYNGTAGIGVFLAAHAAVTGSKPSGELALAGLSHLRHNLNGRNAARMARALGIGGATGLGSVVYAFAAMAKCLNDADLLADAHRTAQLFTDELIAADKQLDVMGGSAGAILALLRLYRDSASEDVLTRATKCGEHLMGQRRLGPAGSRSWAGQGSGAHRLNGMSHGAAGFAYALAGLAAATKRDEFAKAAAECMAFENSSYDEARHNWPDLRVAGVPLWPCQWCHGAPGIGLGRLAMAKRGGVDAKSLTTDIRNALAGLEQTSPQPVDTLCCGTLGGIEFFCEAADALGRNDLADLAAQRLTAVLDRAAATGDYRWNSGKRQFNLGLFRGLAGVGYTLLRRLDATLPNVLIWE